MEIKILGSGCSKCKQLEINVKEALSELGKEATIIKVTDFIEIAGYNVMQTPALVINEKLVSTGRVYSSYEIKEFLA